MRRVETRSAPPRAAVEDMSVLDELPQLVREYVRSSRRGEVPVVEQLPAAELRRRLDLALGPEGRSDGDLLGLLVDYLRYAVRTAHPQFHNQLFSGFSLASFLGEVVGALTNTTMSTFEASPAGTLIEAEVLARLGGAVGGGSREWEEGGGILCTGGSNANLLGMLCARQRALPEIARGGLPAGVAGACGARAGLVGAAGPVCSRASACATVAPAISSSWSQGADAITPRCSSSRSSQASWSRVKPS